jgi:hypothetical protein
LTISVANFSNKITNSSAFTLELDKYRQPGMNWGLGYRVGWGVGLMGWNIIRVGWGAEGGYRVGWGWLGCGAGLAWVKGLAGVWGGVGNGVG